MGKGKKSHTSDGLIEQAGHAVKELAAQNDRGTALVAAAFLDETLAHLLRMNFVVESRVSDKLMKFDGALGAFSSRINLAYCLGLISEDEHHDMDQMRGIRNDFAHFAGALNFETQSVRDRCAGLRITRHFRELMRSHARVELKSDPKSRFVACFAVLSIAIASRSLMAEDDRPVCDTGELKDVTKFMELFVWLGARVVGGDEDDDESGVD